MILKLPYDAMIENAAKGVVDGKKVQFFMRVSVNELNIEEAIKKHKKNKWIVAFDYTGELGFLKTVDLQGAKVIMKFDVPELSEYFVTDVMSKVPSNVRAVFELPDTFSDMQTIHDYSQKFENISFCGGYLFRIDGCRIGCIQASDINKKINESRLTSICSGCSCVYDVVDIDSVDEIEFYDDKNAFGTLTVAKSKDINVKSAPKKPMSSLLHITADDAFANFGRR